MTLGAWILFLILGFFVLPGRAGAQAWTPVGPPGGDVRALSVNPRDPDQIFLGTGLGVLYRSDDGGEHWQRMPPAAALLGASLDEIVVDSQGILWIGYWQVAGRGGGVVWSEDGGRTFEELSGLEGESVRALALSPLDPRSIAVGTLSGVFLSQDRGAHWKRITPEDHPDLRYLESVAFDPHNPEHLYVGTWHLAWKTTDAGKHWIPIHQGMIDDSHIMTLSVDPWDSKTLYATACTGIYRSRNSGAQWTKLEGIPESSRRTRAFARDVHDPKVLWAGTTEGLWLSRTRGDSWRLLTPKDLVVNAILVRPDGDVLLGTEGAGVLRSQDGGRTWVESNRGFSERFISKLLFDPEGGQLLAGIWGDARYGGVFAASSLPGKWTHLEKGLTGRQVLSLAIQDGTILAGTDDGIFTWNRGSSSWARLPMEGNAQHARIHELIAVPPSTLVAATPKGVMQSEDSGRTWTVRVLGNGEEISAMVASAYDPGLLIGATRSGIWRSRDGGRSWRHISNGLRGRSPHELAFMPYDDSTVYATTGAGLFRSEDQGRTWRVLGGGIPRTDLTGIAVHPDGNTLYASDFSWGGVFQSTDGGNTWQRMPTTGLASDRVWSLALDPREPDRLLAVSSAGGLHLLVTTLGKAAAETPGSEGSHNASSGRD